MESFGFLSLRKYKYIIAQCMETCLETIARSRFGMSGNMTQSLKIQSMETNLKIPSLGKS